MILTNILVMKINNIDLNSFPCLFFFTKVTTAKFFFSRGVNLSNYFDPFNCLEKNNI